jgi:molybdopterin-binding protein
MKLSARNVLAGKVEQVTPGTVNTEVVVELPGGQRIVSVITRSSAERLGLARGKPVHAIVKASDVMLMTE